MGFNGDYLGPTFIIDDPDDAVGRRLPHDYGVDHISLILRHDDRGLMGQLVVVEPGQQPALTSHTEHDDGTASRLTQHSR